VTQEHYNAQMGRIYSLFGDKAFPAERLKIVWQTCKDLPDRSFTKIIDHFASSFRHAPLPKDFIEAAIRERAGMSPRRFEESAASHEPECNKCCDAGVFEVQHDKTRQIVFIRCDCEMGKDSIHRDFPQWNALKFGNQFTPIFMGHNQRYLIWKPDEGWKPERGMGQLDEKIALWKIIVNESKDFWKACFEGGGERDDLPPAG
jgi:hypothetical protein